VIGFSGVWGIAPGKTRRRAESPTPHADADSEFSD
jgi:hypothetical protein